ncbi:MAG: cobyric acid synthase CobQ, partial [Pseudomonadota bacterium]
RSISDPEGIEGPAGSDPGLGLLDVTTEMVPEKRLDRVRARHSASGLEVDGYEIHIGRTTGPDCARPFATVGGRTEGATSPDGRVTGTYLHGLFSADPFRAAYLNTFGIDATLTYGAEVEATLDALASHLERHMDVPALLALAR